MRKIILLLFSFILLTTSYSTSTLPVEKPRLKASEIYVPLGNTGVKISYADLARISPGDLQKLTGKKMNFVERIGFKATQAKLRKTINDDGTINNRKFNKLLRKDGSGGFHLGGFALGFILGLIGVLIAYLIKDQYHNNRVKWAWLGLIIWLVLWILIIAG